jgi:hypothetical protein
MSNIAGGMGIITAMEPSGGIEKGVERSFLGAFNFTQ